MPHGNQKGSAFERQMCVKLSEWWSGGERQDIFWRSSQSGGRATQRAKLGKRTFGSYGDIAAVDPIGGPLLKMFCIELKRGNSHGSPGDIFDRSNTSVERPFESCLLQARRSALAADSLGWMLISKRDCREAIAYIEADVAKRLNDWAFFLGRPPVVRYDMTVNVKGVGRERFKFIGLPLEAFLSRVSPKQILDCLEEIKTR